LTFRETPPEVADGGMPVQEALKLVAETYLLTLIVPKWLMRLPIQRYGTGEIIIPFINQHRRVRMARLARERLAQFMQEQVTERKLEVAAAPGGDTRADAFTRLVKSNQDESSKYQLDDQELVDCISSELSLPLT
jgi:hypothetical protein